MGAGAVGCGPWMNGVPRPREPKSGRVGVDDGNQSTSPLGSHSRAAGFLSWCSREIIKSSRPWNYTVNWHLIPPFDTHLDVFAYKYRYVWLDAIRFLVQQWAFGDTFFGTGDRSNGRDHLESSRSWAQFMVLEGRLAALSYSVVSVHTAALLHCLPDCCCCCAPVMVLLLLLLLLFFLTSFVVKATESLLEILHWAWSSAVGVNDRINQINTEKVVPFNSRRNLKKDLNQDCHISTAHAHTSTLWKRKQRGGKGKTNQIKLPQYLINVNSALRLSSKSLHD